MDCIVTCDSGNYCMRLSSLLNKEGYHSEVTSTPCKLAKGGCSYSVKFSCDLYDKVAAVAKNNNINIKAAYRIEQKHLKNDYVLF